MFIGDSIFNCYSIFVCYYIFICYSLLVILLFVMLLSAFLPNGQSTICKVERKQEGQHCQ